MVQQHLEPKVESAVEENLILYRDSQVIEFVPLLAYRFTRERLHAAAQV
jgi:hypothetical protein